MRTLSVVGMVALLAGCASTPSAPPGAQTFSGEVWTWDTRESTVTLMQPGGNLVRVKVSPEELRTLEHHGRARVTGTLAPPADVVLVGPTGPVNAVPKGLLDVTEVRGTVTTADAAGRLAITSDRGPLHVWAAAGADQRFPRNTPVTIRMSVQPVDLVPATAPSTPAPAPVGSAAASPTSEPGDHAVVNGRIIGINPGGVLIVESPTGPVQILVSDSSRYKIGEPVQVRTTVRAAS